jgi:hypothetical protein
LATRVTGGCCDPLFKEDDGLDAVDALLSPDEIEKLLLGNPSSEDLAKAESSLTVLLAGPSTIHATWLSPLPLQSGQSTSFPPDLWTAGTQASIQMSRVVSIPGGRLKGLVDGAEEGQGTTVRLAVLWKAAGSTVKKLEWLEKDVEVPDSELGFAVSIDEANLEEFSKAIGKDEGSALASLVDTLAFPGLSISEGKLWWKLPERV